MIIETQNGQRLELPDGSTPNQIDEVLGHFQSQQNPGFMDRMGADLDKRKQQFADIHARDDAGQSIPSTGLQIAGTYAGALGDLAGNAVGSAARYARQLVPQGVDDAVTNNLQETGKALKESLVGRGAASLAQNAASEYSGFENSYPTTAANINSAVNIASLLPMGKAAQVAHVDDALALAGKAAMTPAKSIVGGVSDIAKGVTARDGQELAEAVRGAKSDAVSIKNAADLSNVTLSPAETNSLLGNLDTALKGVKLIPEFTPKTMGVIRTIKEDAANGSLNLNDIDQYRRLLGGAKAEDSVAAASVRKAIDSTLNGLTTNGKTANAVSLLNEFRKDFSQASKFEDISNIITSADGNQNRLKAKLTKFLNDNNQKPPGWNDKEISALTRAAKSSYPEKILRGIGTFGFDIGNGTKNVALPGLASMSALLAPGIGAPVVAGGTAARQAAKYLARGKAEGLLRILEQKP